MTDFLSSEDRSELMSKVSGKDTKPEMIVRKYLWHQGFRYRKNDSRYPGSPDIVLPKYNTVIFVHGCFWHGHGNCTDAGLPDTNREYWEKKRKANKDRDKRKQEKLKNQGWKVITVWSCELKTQAGRNRRLINLVSQIEEK